MTSYLNLCPFTVVTVGISFYLDDALVACIRAIGIVLLLASIHIALTVLETWLIWNSNVDDTNIFSFEITRSELLNRYQPLLTISLPSFNHVTKLKVFHVCDVINQTKKYNRENDLMLGYIWQIMMTTKDHYIWVTSSQQVTNQTNQITVNSKSYCEQKSSIRSCQKRQC